MIRDVSPPAGGPAASMTVRGFASVMTARRYSLMLASTSVSWTAAGAAVWHVAVGSCWSMAAGYTGARLLTALSQELTRSMRFEQVVKSLGLTGIT